MKGKERKDREKDGRKNKFGDGRRLQKKKERENGQK